MDVHHSGVQFCTINNERYWSYYTEDIAHHLFSCTKSFTGTLVGIAIKEGFIDNVSQKVLDFFPEMTIENMDARKESMTVARNLDNLGHLIQD